MNKQIEQLKKFIEDEQQKEGYSFNVGIIIGFKIILNKIKNIEDNDSCISLTEAGY